MMKALVIEKTDGKPGQVYYPLKQVDLPKPSIRPGEVLVKILAAALNHREVFIRQHLYPGINFETPLGADGVGIVVETSSPDLEHQWKGKKVILTPGRGWESNEDGPEGKYAIVGGTVGVSHGTLQEYVALPASELEEAPGHLSIPEAAAIPLAGLTAWRATFTKGKLRAGDNVLITGIGGGVALFALQFAVAAGATVFVTSGSEEKIARAKELGAADGVNYKKEDWSKQLKGLLPKNRPYLDTVIDGAGGDIVLQTYGLLKLGGVIVSYGMTTNPKVVFPMQAVLKNIEIRGSTMGSRKEFKEMVSFVNKHGIEPVVSTTVKGLSRADEVFEIMKKGTQFGKLVVELGDDAGEAARL
ncbi:hypothetical protein TWF102_011855 [Orbilia oligospora]|uniref:Enoyl reductase (ER) domain-containing protein n=1 Tax=Orbilia oligospora TaxID=2813651 RepID=A0A7C8IZT3_ORBOL|nr:hypothetical protein TWF102_011855 [Orbilia oligospora]KAF3111108.1 hypothetical protein TWF103_003794 [Orbilia oligospora]KAF3111109.1 hypothetical protein TWF103_003794 [Orbilia oligospora]KAF3115601.1 hypothetical protein TWF706_005719 [Orbilia oligospora]KAF3115602.1 hypothetical protein TWF706_005719 [Orbilia oligospora]